MPTQQPDDGEYLPDVAVARRYGISWRSIQRWEQDPRLGFPPALVIRGRKFRKRSQLEAWERQQVKQRTSL
jgi:hypothetical protein